MLLWTLPASVWANASAWDHHHPTGTPGPESAEHLVLEREEVTFDEGRLRADFWVRNTSDAAVDKEMGFPVTNADEAEDADALEPIEISSSDESLDHRVRTDREGDYPTVLLWSMEFPAGETTNFTVEHELNFSTIRHESPKLSAHVRFSYITHTGANWAGDVGEATFRFCEADATRLIELSRGAQPHFTPYLRGSVAIETEIGPEPWRWDDDENCVVWERSDWKPEKGESDLSLAIEILGSNWEYPDRDRALDRWCGHYDLDNHFEIWRVYNGQPVTPEASEWPADKTDPDAEQLAEAVGVFDVPLTDQRLDEIWSVAWELVRNTRPLHVAQKTGSMRKPSLDSLPEFRRVELRRTLYRYLRNYVGARSGHEFDDPGLAACFAPVSHDLEALSETANQNVEFLQKREGELRQKFRELRERARDEAVSLEDVERRFNRIAGREYERTDDEIASWTFEATDETIYSTPVPAEESPLELVREDVLVYRNRAFVTLEVRNPTAEAISTQFVVDADGPEVLEPWTSDAEPRPNIELLVDGRRRDFDAEDDGDATHAWRADFDAGQTRTMTLNLSRVRGWSREAVEDADGLKWPELSFRYRPASGGFASEERAATDIRICRSRFDRVLGERGLGWSDYESPDGSAKRLNSRFEVNHGAEPEVDRQRRCVRWRGAPPAEGAVEITLRREFE